jgi:hypothetical protein
MPEKPSKARIEQIISQLQSGSRKLTESELKDLQSTIENVENLAASETHHETTKHHTKSALALQDVLEQFGRNQ